MNERFVTTWRNKWITSEAKTIDDFIDTYENLLEMFKGWKERGVKLNPDSGISDDYAEFYTDDSIVAADLEFLNESEYYGYDEDDFSEEED